jgi:hypothetical protein
MKQIKKPDVTAPRFRPEVHNVLTKEFFKAFRKKHPKFKDVDIEVLRSIAKTFNRTVFQTVIDTRDGVQLPESIGWLFIGTCQQSKKKNIDFAKSHMYGVTVSNNNWATDGKLAKIFYTNYAPRIKMKNKEYWSFVACREFKRSVAKSYPENWNMYAAVEPNTKIRNTYQKIVRKDFAIKMQNKALETYNEFDL